MVFNKAIKKSLSTGEGFRVRLRNSPFRGLGGLCFLLCAFSFQPVHAQSFAEWFNQKKTQIKYLTQQIAALQAYKSSLEQGYGMMKTEWGAIGNFKNGEFGMHQDHYRSLSAVNPQVKSSVNLTSIQSEQQSIVNQFNSLNKLNGLQANERAYISSVRQNIIAQCSKDLDDLHTVLTAGELQMTDDERIKRINQITANIKDKYVFTCSFVGQVRLLALQRDQDDQHTQTLIRYDEAN